MSLGAKSEKIRSPQGLKPARFRSRPSSFQGQQPHGYLWVFLRLEVIYLQLLGFKRAQLFPKNLIGNFARRVTALQSIWGCTSGYYDDWSFPLLYHGFTFYHFLHRGTFMSAVLPLENHCCTIWKAKRPNKASLAAAVWLRKMAWFKGGIARNPCVFPSECRVSRLFSPRAQGNEGC